MEVENLGDDTEPDEEDLEHVDTSVIRPLTGAVGETQNLPDPVPDLVTGNDQSGSVSTGVLRSDLKNLQKGMRVQYKTWMMVMSGILLSLSRDLVRRLVNIRTNGMLRMILMVDMWLTLVVLMNGR